MHALKLYSHADSAPQTGPASNIMWIVRHTRSSPQALSKSPKDFNSNAAAHVAVSRYCGFSPVTSLLHRRTQCRRRRLLHDRTPETATRCCLGPGQQIREPGLAAPNLPGLVEAPESFLGEC